MNAMQCLNREFIISPHQTHAVERGMSASIGGLMDVERAAAACPVGPTDYLAYLQEARRFFLDDVVTNVRFGSVLKVSRNSRRFSHASAWHH